VDATSSSSRREPFVVAHRAGNCLRALRDAERLGISLVEADLRLFRGRIDVRHLKSVGSLPLYWDRWRLAAPWSRHLTLDDLLRATHSRTELMLDLKGRRVELAKRVADAIAPLVAERRFTLCARAPALLEPFRELPVRRFQSVGSARQLARLLRRGAEPGVDGVSINARLLNADALRELRRVTDLVLTWPVNRVEEAHRLGGLGVDGLISDAPSLLLAARTRA
jgi:glycerophosphoryl diester phosphodiesterase